MSITNSVVNGARVAIVLKLSSIISFMVWPRSVLMQDSKSGATVSDVERRKDCERRAAIKDGFPFGCGVNESRDCRKVVHHRADGQESSL